jgi:tRNA(fMet)-specific endonuclease VapC
MRCVIVDTDVLINFLRGAEKTRTYLAALLAEAEISCSAITVAEIHAGMKEHERAKTEELFDSLTIVDVTREIAERAGTYRRSIRSHSLELDDCLIAATAYVKKAALATGNSKHYPMGDVEKVVVRL